MVRVSRIACGVKRVRLISEGLCIYTLFSFSLSFIFLIKSFIHLYITFCNFIHLNIYTSRFMLLNCSVLINCFYYCFHEIS